MMTMASVYGMTQFEGVTAYFEYVTPDEAAAMLNDNHEHNRRIDEHRVKTLVRYIHANEFEINGDTVRFDQNGKLLDGQHRLTAIARSGKGQMLLIVRGLDPTTFGTIDQGKPRTVANILSSAGVSLTNGSNVISGASIIMAGSQLPTDRLSVAEYVVTHRDRLEPIASWAKGVSAQSPKDGGAAWTNRGATHILSPSPLIALTDFMCKTADLETVQLFFEHVADIPSAATVSNVTRVNTNVLRKRLLATPLVRRGGTQTTFLFSTFEMIINVYNRTVAGEQIRFAKHTSKVYRTFADLSRAEVGNI